MLIHIFILQAKRHNAIFWEKSLRTAQYDEMSSYIAMGKII